MRFHAYSIRFTPDELEAIRERSRREKRPISEIVRAALKAAAPATRIDWDAITSTSGEAHHTFERAGQQGAGTQ